MRVKEGWGAGGHIPQTPLGHAKALQQQAAGAGAVGERPEGETGAGTGAGAVGEWPGGEAGAGAEDAVEQGSDGGGGGDDDEE